MSKKKIIALILTMALVSQQGSTLVLANEQIKESNKNKISEEKTNSLEKVGSMKVQAIDPEINPALNDWLSWEVAESVLGDKDKYNELTQNDFNKVTKIDGKYATFGATLSEQIGNLVNLEELNLPKKLSIGYIPDEIGNLVNIHRLDLSNNNVSDINVEGIGNLTNLTYLNLENNNLNGDITSIIRKLTKLKYLNLKSNRLCGAILENIEELVDLESLILSNNYFYGEISPNITKLQKINLVNIDSNRFIGNTPRELNIENYQCKENFLFNQDSQIDLNFNKGKKLYLGVNQIISDEIIKSMIYSLNSFPYPGKNDNLQEIYEVEIIPTEEGKIEKVNGGYKANEIGNIEVQVKIKYNGTSEYTDNNTYNIEVVKEINDELIYRELYLKLYEFRYNLQGDETLVKENNRKMLEVLEEYRELVPYFNDYYYKQSEEKRDFCLSTIGYEICSIYNNDDIKKAVEEAIINSIGITEFNKFDRDDINIGENKGNEPIDITKQVLRLQDGEKIDDNNKIIVVGIGDRVYNPETGGGVVEHDLFEVTEEGRILLKKSNLENNLSVEAYIKIMVPYNNEYITLDRYISFSINKFNSEIETLYNEISALINSDSYTKEGLVQLLEKNNEITSIQNYTKNLDQLRRDVLGNAFKESFEAGSKYNKEHNIRFSLSNAKAITESSKLVGHHQSENCIVKISQPKGTEKIDITDQLLQVEGNQKLLDSTLIEFRNTYSDILTIKNDRVLLDSSKLSLSFKTAIDIKLTVSNLGGTFTNINLNIIVPQPSSNEIRNEIENMSPENTTITVNPTIDDDNSEIELEKNIIDLIIDKGLDLKIPSNMADVTVDSNTLKGLNNTLNNEEPLVLTVKAVNDSIINNVLPNDTKAIGNIKLDSNIGIKNLNGTIKVRINVGQDSNKSSVIDKANKVYVYSINNSKTTLIQEANKDSEGYVEFVTKTLGDIIITDKKIDSKPIVPSIPNNPSVPEVPSINELPVITANDITIIEGEEFNPLIGVTATDKEDGDLTSKIEITKNEVDINSVGCYKVIYKVVDSKGEATIKEIIVTVKKKESTIIKGWYNDSQGNWKYYDNSGRLTTGWQLISGKWYYMNNSGVMQTGWLMVGDNWYYLNESGDMATGWKSLNGKWYYMSQSGSMVTGWLKLGDSWYYLNENGAMATGWVRDKENWYYLDSNGEMAYNITIDGWYLNNNGIGSEIKK